MLQEVIFVLSGFPSSIFVPYPPEPETPSTYSIAPDFPSLHQAERESLNRLGQLGFLYVQLNKFVKKIKERRHAKLRGAYAQAMAAGFEQILKDYIQDVLDMEHKILSKELEAGAGIVPVSLLASELSQWELLLPALQRLAVKLDKKDGDDDGATIHKRGCRLFDVFLKEAHTGHEAYRNAMERIISHLCDVLYRQMTSWMIFGRLVDDEHEFFVAKHANAIEGAAGWQRQYIVVHDRIPQHIPVSLAESILFIGKAVATVQDIDQQQQKPSRKNEHQQEMLLLRMPDELKKSHMEQLLSLHSSNKRSVVWTPQYVHELQRIIQNIKHSTANWLFSRVLVGKQGLERYIESFRNMFLLGYGDLAANFIQECEKWRSGALVEHNETTATASGTGGGGRRTSTTSSRVSVTSASGHKVAMIFRHQEINALLVKASVWTDAEATLEEGGYSVKLMQHNNEQQDYVEPLMFSDLLLSKDIPCTLEYTMTWPIDLFLSQSDIRQYSQLWCYLIGIKTVQMSLSGMLRLLREERSTTIGGRKSSSSSSSDNTGDDDKQRVYRERSIWILRAQMLYWVDTLWNHIQANVIHPHYEKLIHTITRSNRGDDVGFEQLQIAHSEYLSNVMHGCLLQSSECNALIYRALRLCLTFCELVEQIYQEEDWKRSKKRKTGKTAAEIVSEWTRSFDKSGQQVWMDRLDELAKTFVDTTSKLFNVVSDLPPDIKISGDLDVLLLQLDYNKWFSGGDPAL